MQGSYNTALQHTSTATVRLAQTLLESNAAARSNQCKVLSLSRMVAYESYQLAHPTFSYLDQSFNLNR